MRLAYVIALGLAACGPRSVLGHGRTGRAVATDPSAADTGPGPVSDGRGAAEPAAPGAAGRGRGAAEPAAPGPVSDGRGAADPAAEVRVVSAAEMEAASGVVISRLPAPHRSTVPAAFTPAEPGAARAIVGQRDARHGLAFALDVAAAFTGAAPPEVADGDALVRWAQERGQWLAIVPGVRPSEGALRPGDLLVLDRAEGNRPASLVAVVLGTDARGVTDILYVARGVVRRGYVDPVRPAVARDREGRAVNSYVRHGGDYPPAGTRYLAGELAGGRVRIR